MSQDRSPDNAREESSPASRPRSVSTGDLAFVLQVLIPRAWVQGREVDALVELRSKLEQILAQVDRDAPA